MIDNAESVVRILFPNKILHGKVMGGAFALRSWRDESYLSVFRLNGPTFKKDILGLDKGRNLDCATLSVGNIRDINLEESGNIASCDVIEIGDIDKTSHAGIFAYINNKPLIGGHENEVDSDERGSSIGALALALQHRLAMIAQNGLTHVNTLLQ